MTAIFIEWLMH